MDTIVSEDRPNLDKKSEGFATVKGVAVGAAVAAALTTAYAAVPGIRKSMGFESFSEAVKKMVPLTAGVSAIANGWAAGEQTRGENEQKDKVRPYVEKLEADRNRLADLAINGAPAQRG